jgi:ribosome recycling factor
MDEIILITEEKMTKTIQSFKNYITKIRTGVKKLQKEMEQFKVEIRNARRDGMDKVKKNKDISEDEVKGLENEIQKLTDTYIAQLEAIAKEKEKELMTI